ncbi:hypothetical protein HHK36_010186 [Tetracentron sinense]|uniref:Dehydrin n=1 Tax=Tetracentron sinense TaxID=13715 RepID=A0A834ZDE3_TETSI|nr:hypothetical protein HHK36_010186 [Tetracentron sinense]
MSDMRDEYGNPVRQTGTTGAHGTTPGTGMQGGGGYGKTTGTGMHGGGGPGTGTDMGGQYQPQKQHGVSDEVRRSGSGSSSSSEDDGEGGRRKKKGLKGKIMGKLPGGGHKDEQMQTTNPGGYGATKQGGHGGTTQGGLGGPTQGGYGADQNQDKGMMDKIKEKLPGHH